jgi:hypothetical protein
MKVKVILNISFIQINIITDKQFNKLENFSLQLSEI